MDCFINFDQDHPDLGLLAENIFELLGPGKTEKLLDLLDSALEEHYYTDEDYEYEEGEEDDMDDPWQEDESEPDDDVI